MLSYTNSGIGGGGGGTGNVTTSGLSARVYPIATTATNIEDSNLMTDASLNNLMYNGLNFVVGSNLAGDSSAMLQVEGTARGFLLPRLTQAQRLAILTPAAGLQVYQTNLAKGVYYYDGAAWVLQGAGGTVLSSGMTAGTMPIATAAQTIENSSLKVSAGNIWTFNLNGANNANVQMQQIGGLGAAPTIATGVNTTAASIAGTDLGGNFTVTFAAAIAGGGIVATITFNQAFTTAPSCIQVTPAANVAGNGSFGIHCELSTITTTKFDVIASATFVGLALSTQSFYYSIIQ